MNNITKILIPNRGEIACRILGTLNRMNIPGVVVYHAVDEDSPAVHPGFGFLGETAYIRAFGRTFTLHIVNPVEQAAQETATGSDTARGPMPGMVVEILVSEGETLTKGQPMITIESMKIMWILNLLNSVLLKSTIKN